MHCSVFKVTIDFHLTDVNILLICRNNHVFFPHIYELIVAFQSFADVTCVKLYFIMYLCHTVQRAIKMHQCGTGKATKLIAFGQITQMDLWLTAYIDFSIRFSFKSFSFSLVSRALLSFFQSVLLLLVSQFVCLFFTFLITFSIFFLCYVIGATNEHFYFSQFCMYAVLFQLVFSS